MQKEQDGKALVRAIHKQDQERHDKLAAQELVEAGHQVELAQLKQSLLLAQQGANGASHKQL